MAPKKTGPKLKKAPQTAQEKAARANLVAAEQASLEQVGTRVSTQSRGAFAQRRLRSGGTDLQRYSMGSYKDDPFPKFGTTGGGAAPSAPTSGTTAKRTTKPKPKAKPKPKGRREVTADLSKGAPKNRKPVTKPRATDFEARREEEARRQAEAKRKREAAAKKRKADQDAGRGVVRPPTGGGTTAS